MKNRLKYFLPTIVLFCFISGATGQKSTFEISGDIIQDALPIAAFGSTFIWKDDQKPTWQFVKTMGTSFLLTHGLKRLINKERPDGGKYSFPSGHTSAAFTGAAFFQIRHGWKIGAPLYALAVYTGWTRVHANRHDWWDILGGAAVGIGSAYLFTKPYQKNALEVSFGKYKDGFVFDLSINF